MPPSRDLDRTDSVERKLGLLAAAYAAGRRDLAMSLAASIKDTLLFERSRRPEISRRRSTRPPTSSPGWATSRRPGRPGLAGGPTSNRLAVRDRQPGAGRGAGLDLARHPRDQATDPPREIRVARIAADSSLREVPCQVTG